MRANGNILYVDEINLLSNSIINALVGVNRYNHIEKVFNNLQSSFVLIGLWIMRKVE